MFTDDGDKKVTYRLYKGVVYVARPVDTKYQSLNVSVPVEIDGKAVDATGAPILLANRIGGYLSSSVTSGSGPGGPGARWDGQQRGLGARLGVRRGGAGGAGP
ncbi:hypothetical protein [Streptomyces sp. NPDC094472]|uniref:hypothetical protein n=1 Tax=unclassified Streptomyces TaxID=2593676 RepID=UPI003319A53E